MNITFYNSDQIESMLKSLNLMTESIENASEVFIRLGKEGFHHKLAEDWISQYKLFSSPEQYEKRLAFLYLCNDIIQKCKSSTPLYVEDFKPHILEVFESLVKQKDTIVKNAINLVNIWKERKIFSKDVLHEMIRILTNGSSNKDNDSQPNGDLPEGLIKVPTELISFVDCNIELQKWCDKTADSENKLREAILESEFSEDEASLYLPDYKRCLELEQKYRTNLLKSELNLMRQADADHASFVHMFKKISNLFQEVQNILNTQ
jgi:hypothetical protein